MSRYFFHRHDGGTSLDDEGIELVDLNTAREEAIRTCGEMVRELPVTVCRGYTLRLWVTDQPDGSGTTVFALTVSVQEG